jgi:hypothetical protein
VDSEEIKKPKPIPTKYFNTGPEPDIWQSDIWQSLPINMN